MGRMSEPSGRTSSWSEPAVIDGIHVGTYYADGSFVTEPNIKCVRTDDGPPPDVDHRRGGYADLALMWLVGFGLFWGMMLAVILHGAR